MVLSETSTLRKHPWVQRACGAISTFRCAGLTHKNTRHVMGPTAVWRCHCRHHPPPPAWRSWLWGQGGGSGSGVSVDHIFTGVLGRTKHQEPGSQDLVAGAKCPGGLRLLTHLRSEQGSGRGGQGGTRRVGVRGLLPAAPQGFLVSLKSPNDEHTSHGN